MRDEIKKGKRCKRERKKGKAESATVRGCGAVEGAGATRAGGERDRNGGFGM